MRIALVTPYSWTYRGGVNGHVEALAEQFLGRGHDVRVLAPWDPPDRLSRWLHRAPAEDRARPDYLVPLARTIGFSANGSISPLCAFPDGMARMRRELRDGDYDIVHVHEPIVPFIGWDASAWRHAPVVGTFHAYSTKWMPNQIANLLGARRRFNHLHARIAVSQAAAWTGRRFFGGDYTIIPNGVDLDGAPSGPKPESDELRIVFVGRPEERKGLPVLMSAFAALVQHVPARLVLVGTDAEEIEPYLPDPDVAQFVDARGRVRRAELWQALHEADVLSAPSLSGESFGMVLTEAFAAGTPVIASDIGGYRDVVRDGEDGVLVPPADPQRLAEELQTMYLEPERRRAMGESARKHARRYAWPRVADEVTEVYERAIEAPAPSGAAERIVKGAGLAPASGGPRRPAERLPSLDPAPTTGRGALVRRVAMWCRRPARRRADGARRQPHRPRQRRRELRPLEARLGADRAGADDALDVRARGLLVRDRPRRAAQPHRPPPRHHLGDDDRGVDVGHAAGAPRRARSRRRRRAAHGPHARDLPRRRRDPRLAEHPQRARARDPRRDHRLDDRPLPPEPEGALPRQLPAGRAAGRGRRRADARAPERQRAGSRGSPRRCAVPCFRCAPASPSSRTCAAAASPPGRSSPPGRFRRSRATRSSRRSGSTSTARSRAAAAVLFAVNVTAVVPATPSNIGVFQLAVISVLVGGFGVDAADALAYGIILQAVEIATAVALGVPALVREGVTWRDLRLRALQTAPVQLSRRESRTGQPTAG